MFKKIISSILLASLLFCSISFVSNALYAPSVVGDIDKDGKLSTTDILRVKKFFLNQIELFEKEFFNADLDCNRRINSTDYLLMKKMCLENNTLKAVSLYVKDELSYNLITQTAYFDGSIESLVAELEKAKAIPKNTKVYSFSIENETAYIDLSEEFGKALEMGATEEALVSGSLANTIIRCYNVEKVFFTVEGEILETGYIRYDFPLEYFSIITLYHPDEDYISFDEIHSNFNGTISGLVETLSQTGPFPKDVKVYSFSISGGIAYIDLSQEFGNALATGTAAESATIKSLVNTIIKYYNVDRVRFTVEGEFFDSGHAIHCAPIGFSQSIY